MVSTGVVNRFEACPATVLAGKNGTELLIANDEPMALAA